MSEHQIAHYYPNGDLLERYAVHIEANPDEDWEMAVETCATGETVVLFVDGVEIDRFFNDPQF